MFSNESCPKSTTVPTLSVLLPRQVMLRFRKSFFNSKSALQVDTSAKRKKTIISSASSTLAEHLCHRITLPALVLSQHTQVTRTWATAAQPISLYQQGYLNLILSLFWYLQELEAMLGKHMLQCSQTTQQSGTSQREGEHFATCYNGPISRKCRAGESQRQGKGSRG